MRGSSDSRLLPSGNTRPGQAAPTCARRTRACRSSSPKCSPEPRHPSTDPSARSRHPERLWYGAASPASTLWAAEQYGEQASKGSLETGKLADLVILDKNPLKVDKMAIKDIKVLQTIKEGKSIYTAP